MSGRPYEIVVGEVRRVLRDMPDASFDACLSDPPYGLAFMGNRWDYDVPSVNVFVEVLRVLKPGAHAMFFGGTRTFHRMSVNIEDAGFLPVDLCMWLYGSGFSKTIDIGKHIDRKKDTRAEVLEVTGWIRATAKAKRISNSVIDDHFGLKGMAGHWTTLKSQPLVPTAEQWPELLKLLGVEPPEAIRAIADRVSREKGQPGDAWFAREKVGEEKAISGSYSPGPQASTVMRPITIAAQEESARWSGYGNLLKPAWEPIGLFCKMHEGTIAENCLRYGTGGLDIDGARVGETGGPAGTDYAKTGLFGMGGKATIKQLNKGRMPANLMLSHSPDCVKVGTRVAERPELKKERPNAEKIAEYKGSRNSFSSPLLNVAPKVVGTIREEEEYRCAPDCAVRLLDRQSGNRRSTLTGRADPSVTHAHPADPDRMRYSMFGNGRAGGLVYADDGGASRFFYNAKVQRSERDRGLDDFDAVAKGIGALRDGVRQGTAKNAHPTLKPIDLCRYFARMLLPPSRADGKPRRLLVPFSGAGSEMIGALQAGWDEVVGIELVPKHAEWARARIAKGCIIRHSK